MKTVSYAGIFLIILLLLYLLPMEGGYVVQIEVVNGLMAALFTLLVWLITRLLGTGGTPSGVWATAALTLLLCPGAEDMYERSIEGVFSMCSLCITPFFISQYYRVSGKDFKWRYFLMFFMGIFCSYTHSGLSIPLCLSFLTLAYMEKGTFFRSACWPMVVGFVIGTTMAILASNRLGAYTLKPEQMTRTTTHTLLLLWNTKAFVAALGVTVWCIVSRTRRKMLQRVYVRNRLLGYCMLYSLAIIPFAPLGVDFAVEGVCLFGMFWVMLLGYRLLHKMRFKGDGPLTWSWV